MTRSFETTPLDGTVALLLPSLLLVTLPGSDGRPACSVVDPTNLQLRLGEARDSWDVAVLLDGEGTVGRYLGRGRDRQPCLTLNRRS